jgi:HPt (histidine-containing phosphotransfer) domain-containing protein
MVVDNPINPEALDAMLEMLGGDTAFLAEMIDSYLADSPQLLANIQRAVASGDAELLRRMAHSLKSNSEGFGATTLAALARHLEDLGRVGDTASASALLADVISEYGRVQTALIAVRPEG